MASLGDFGVQLIGSLGGKPTKQSQKLFRAWQQREGGWTNNSARFNPLNLTAPGSGLPTINSVGVVSLPNMQAGIKRTANLIKSGYPAIYQALRTGQVDFNNPALQADFNRWVSGNRTPGMSKYVSGVASAYGQNIPVSTTPLSTSPAPVAGRQPGGPPPPPQKPTFDPQAYASKILGQYASGGSVDFTQLPGVVGSSFTTPPPAAPGAAAPPGSDGASGAAPIDAVMPNDGIGARAVKMAATQLGDPYVFGASSAGKDPGSFDCSSLVQWSYRQLGINVPRDTYGQQKVLRPKSWDHLQPGDPIYRRSGGHVVIYAGNGRVIAAPHTGTVVQYQPLSNFSRDEYVPYQIPHHKL